MVEEIRTTFLNTLPLTKTKEERLEALTDRCIEGIDFLLGAISWLKLHKEKISRYLLQDMTYGYLKQNLNLQSQIIIDLVKDAFAQNDSYEFEKYSIPYNVPRSGKLSMTKNGNPTMSIAVAPRERIGIPIAKDGTWARFNQLLHEGYTWSAFKLVKKSDGWKIAIPLMRNIPLSLIPPQSIMGIDIGSRCLAAVTVLTRKGMEKQLYLGRDICEQQRDISLRRSMLQKHKGEGEDKEKAKRGLERMKHGEKNYVKTRCYQIAHQIVNIAKSYKSLIAIEELKGLRNAKGYKKANRRNKRIPYHTFRVALESVAKREGVEIIAVSPEHTSKWCPKCGGYGRREKKGKEFICVCGLRINADRLASLNIALRAAETIRNPKSQYSEGGGWVNVLDWHDEGEGVMSWHGYLAPDCKLRPSGRGS